MIKIPNLWGTKEDSGEIMWIKYQHLLMSLRDDYEYIDPPDNFTIMTVVQYADEPEYRKYQISSNELPEFIREMETSQHAERIISIDEGII
jgi:hypothetical protein